LKYIWTTTKVEWTIIDKTLNKYLFTLIGKTINHHKILKFVSSFFKLLVFFPSICLMRGDQLSQQGLLLWNTRSHGPITSCKNSRVPSKRKGKILVMIGSWRKRVPAWHFPLLLLWSTSLSQKLILGLPSLYMVLLIIS